MRAAARLAPPGLEVEAWAGLGTLPLFSPDLEAAPSVLDLRGRIADADAVLIVTPEYAYGTPGALKNALDWLVSSGELYRKPVVALSASPSERGGDRALASLRQTLAALDADVPEGASFAVPFVRSVLEDGEVADPEVAARVRAAFRSLSA